MTKPKRYTKSAPRFWSMTRGLIAFPLNCWRSITSSKELKWPSILPMKTAPRDEYRHVLLAVKGEREMLPACWLAHRKFWWVNADRRVIEANCLGWLPLPPVKAKDAAPLADDSKQTEVL